MARVIIPAFDFSGAPLTGLSLTWEAVFNAATEVAHLPEPGITEIGTTGLYFFDQQEGVDLTGIVDLGATALPRYMVYSADHSTTFAAFDASAVPLAGLSVTWDRLKDIEGNDFTPQPIIVELGLGMYKIARHAGRAIGYLDLTSAATPRYVAFDSEDVRAIADPVTPDDAPALVGLGSSVVESVLPVDLQLGDNNELVLSGGDLTLSSGVAATEQQCHLALLAFQGEWFADLKSGVPWYQSILGEKFNRDLAVVTFRNALLDVDTVDTVENLTVEFDNSLRILDVKWTVISTLGEAIESTTSL